MTLSGLRYRLNDLWVRVPLVWRGLPHGSHPHVDIGRRLTHTSIDVIFDVGANHGQSAALLRRWYPSATIHCFEPVSSTFEILQAAARRWPSVHAHRLGLSAAAGRAAIALSTDDSQSHLHPAGPEASREVIDLDTLDAFCGRQPCAHIGYLKIDTEGHDVAVLQGGAGLLGHGSVDVVEVEAGMNPDNHFHASVESLTDCLRGHGYRLFGVYEQVLEWPTADAYLRRANLLFISPDTARRNRWMGR